jgi:hypothetical protein
MAIDWTAQLSEQLDWYWSALLRPRLEGLTDDEYFWEPAPDCWTVRRGADGRWRPDHAFPEPVPPPLTTIAWRLCHVAGLNLALRANTWFGDGDLTMETIDWPGSAAEALAFLEAGYEAWRTGVAALDEPGLERPLGPVGGPWSEYPFAALILHVNREVFHHAAEVALLRDLYRVRV